MTTATSTAFVTGASGFVGKALVRRLRAEGYQVRALCRSVAKGTALAAEGAELIIGDLQDPASLRAGCAGCEVVFHVAAAVVGASAAVMYNINVQGTRNIAKAAHEMGVKRFVHVSTIAVYGPYLDGVITEDHPQHPPRSDFYMSTKSMGETALWRYAERVGLPTVSVRPSFIYGEGSALWSQQVYEICARFPVPMFAGGGGNAHPVHINDVVGLLITCAEHPNAPGYAFHAAPDPAPTWAEFLAPYAEIAGNTRRLHVPIPRTQWFRRATDVGSRLMRLGGIGNDLFGSLHFTTANITYSMERAATLLGWRNQVSLAEGMALTAPWLRSLAVRKS